MNEFDRINTLLVEVGQRNGVPGLYLAPNGTCRLKLQDNTSLYFEWVAEAAKFFIYTPLLEFPSGQSSRIAVFEIIAELNCLSLRRGVLTAHIPTSQVLYQITFDAATLDANQIENGLEILLDERPSLLANIKEALDSALQETPASANSAVEKPVKSWSGELTALQKKGIHFRYQPCSEKDIVLVEAEFGERLPGQYRQFLAQMGRGSDLLFLGEDIFFPHLLSFEQRAKDMLAANNVQLGLPKDAFVFFIHRDMQFFFFRLGTGDDPLIYSYSHEEAAKGFMPIYQSFSEFMRIYIAMHVSNYHTLAKIRAKAGA